MVTYTPTKNNKKPQIINISINKYSHCLFYLFGAALLVLNKFRHAIQGYKTPRNFSSSEIEKAIEYDESVVKGWLEQLHTYAQNDFSIQNHTILELGPGEDLGIGLTLLAEGVQKYYAVDKNNLIQKNQHRDIFYEKLFEKLATRIPSDKIQQLKKELQRTFQNSPSTLNYLYEKSFTFEKIPKHSIDIIFSQAALEHFDDIKKTIRDLDGIVKSGTVFIAEVDLQTHTRWLRPNDPLNIYRFSNWFYRLCKFSGSPNRVRPFEYVEAFTQAGWEKIEIIALIKLDEKYVTNATAHLSKKFRDPKNQMDILTFVICATKK